MPVYPHARRFQPPRFARSFNGTSDYVRFGNGASFTGVFTAGISIFAWVKFPLLSGAQRIATFEQSGDTNFNTYIQTDTTNFMIGDGVANLISSATLPLNQFCSVCGVTNYTAGGTAVYINGVNAGGTPSGALAYTPSFGHFDVGMLASGGSNYFGALSASMVAVYNRAIPARVVSELNAGLIPRDGLRFLWFPRTKGGPDLDAVGRNVGVVHGTTPAPWQQRIRARPMGAFWWVGGSSGTTVALVGATATTAAGTFYPALTFLLPGAAAATTAGNLSISEVAPIPGAAAAAAAGNFSIAETIPVTGAAAATAAGIFSLSESFTLTGVAAATAAGNIGVSIGTTVPLIGAAAAATAGTISLSESFTLPAAAATAAAGILGATTGIVVSLTGVTATAAAAPLGISTTVTLAGAAAATAAGAFGIDLALALAGAAAATAAGTITPYTGTVLLQGAAVTTAAGIILVETVNPATMTVLVNFTILPPTLPAPNPPPATGPGDVLVTFGT